MSRCKTFSWVVDHLNKANTGIKTKISLAGGVKPIFLIIFNFTCTFQLSRIRFDEVFFEKRCYLSIDRTNGGVISAVWCEYELMIIPEFPYNFSTNNIGTLVEIDIYWTDLIMWSWFSSYISHFISLFLQNNQSCLRVLIIWIFLSHFSFVLLIDRDNIWSICFDFHLKVSWFVSVCFSSHWFVHKGRV